jgi:hypothetical protein
MAQPHGRKKCQNTDSICILVSHGSRSQNPWGLGLRQLSSALKLRSDMFYVWFSYEKRVWRYNGNPTVELSRCLHNIRVKGHLFLVMNICHHTSNMTPLHFPWICDLHWPNVCTGVSLFIFSAGKMLIKFVSLQYNSTLFCLTIPWGLEILEHLTCIVITSDHNI